MAIKAKKVGICESRRRFEQTEQLMRLSAKARRERSIKASKTTNAVKRLFKAVNHE